MVKDLYNRNIDYLRISITDKCNLRCRYCMAEDQKFSEDSLSLEEFLKISEIMIDKGIKKIRITGGEPLVEKNIFKLIEGFRDQGIEDISITTNGILLAEYVKDLKAAGLNRINISLDTLNEEKYEYITRGGKLSKVFEGIKACKEYDISPIKLNVVLLKDFNLDEFEDFLEFSDREDLIVRFIELMPIGEGIKFKDQLVKNSDIINNCKSLKKYNYKSNTGPADYYYREGKNGLIGFISPLSCNFCSSCNRIRLDHEANLISCLHSDKLISLKDALNDDEEIGNIIDKAIRDKPKNHKILQGHTVKRSMNTIGG
ncbi:GTP 3',8-cyclase MoaA [Peptoniphilus catoniae]|uniref:GTP 3',8-cyclase MoaA n=1 Tax=Peptoniphilus catoniae TaxID=1660341 RepID=UPI0010FE7F6F|nr:GTP 3',8-cyclase MoaA [Peptoniphilus catoniae]